MQEKQMLRVDMHAHSWYSADATLSPIQLVRRARAAGLDRLAITDHGAIAGALEASAADPELVIPGEEIRCSCGTDVIGLFLSSWIPVGLSLEETATAIREQGGVVYAPHPFAYVTRPAQRATRVLAVADVVEVFNARAFVGSWNRRAARAARAARLPAAASSDAHFSWELGRVYTRMPAFGDAASFKAALASAQPGPCATITPLVHAASVALQMVRYASGRRHGEPPRLRR